MSELGLNTISFAGHAASSAQFRMLYSEGMSLVEETAGYLDGQGRTASKFYREWPLCSTPPNPCGLPPV